ncbi:MAG: hypothetical protein M3280_12840 [Actinomycetota bacterium]|nr:hypothetical protein [Actinomycetota bacterium]
MSLRRDSTVLCRSYEFLELPWPADDRALLDGVLELQVVGVLRKSERRRRHEQRGKLGLSVNRIPLSSVPVILLLDAYRVEGRLHLAPDMDRFSDAWEAVMRDTRDYLPVTDARIERLDGAEVVSSPFIEVRKADIRAVYPLEETR